MKTKTTRNLSVSEFPLRLQSRTAISVIRSYRFSHMKNSWNDYKVVCQLGQKILSRKSRDKLSKRRKRFEIFSGRTLSNMQQHPAASGIFLPRKGKDKGVYEITRWIPDFRRDLPVFVTVELCNANEFMSSFVKIRAFVHPPRAFFFTNKFTIFRESGTRSYVHFLDILNLKQKFVFLEG